MPIAEMDKIDTDRSEGLRNGTNEMPRNSRTNPSLSYLQGHDQAVIYRPDVQRRESTKALRDYSNKD